MSFKGRASICGAYLQTREQAGSAQQQPPVGRYRHASCAKRLQLQKKRNGAPRFPGCGAPAAAFDKAELDLLLFRHWRCGTIPRIWYSTKREFSISVISIENLEITPRNDMWLMLFVR
jgi:hypothetical protein